MADPADLAQGSIEKENELAIKQRKEEGPKARGKCLACGRGLEPPKRWCDADCRDDYEADEEAKRRRIGRA